jgi:hypothetical protein
VLLTRLPLIRLATNPLDLHALSTLPAFILSQDQTLNRSHISKAKHMAGKPCLYGGTGHGVFATALKSAIFLLAPLKAVL